MLAECMNSRMPCPMTQQNVAWIGEQQALERKTPSRLVDKCGHSDSFND